MLYTEKKIAPQSPPSVRVSLRASIFVQSNVTFKAMLSGRSFQSIGVRASCNATLRSKTNDSSAFYRGLYQGKKFLVERDVTLIRQGDPHGVILKGLEMHFEDQRIRLVGNRRHSPNLEHGALFLVEIIRHRNGSAFRIDLSTVSVRCPTVNPKHSVPSGFRKQNDRVAPCP
mmetsp:Transcript_22827/g.33708  ORF Transcript_22827/g.33708 Transcript_22827/m.33708 type:complete len:172 (-) Transcript_22827:542-1057(-)